MSRMAKPEVGGIAPLFIVRNVPAALAFYRDRLGFDVTFEGPQPDDIFFGIVQRGRAMIMFKDVGVEPIPNHVCDIGHGIARWDAYVFVPDPDALAAEFASRKVEFVEPLQDTDDGLRGFEVKDADGYVLFFGRPIVPPAVAVTPDSDRPATSSTPARRRSRGGRPKPR
jgi:catechol 2,3-dioxygenase-like lactoylglutathione lyase family enzyme